MSRHDLKPLKHVYLTVYTEKNVLFMLLEDLWKVDNIDTPLGVTGIWFDLNGDPVKSNGCLDSQVSYKFFQ